MKNLNSVLEDEIKKKDEAIEILENKIVDLENLQTSKKVSQIKETQTELDRPIFCYECDFPAEDYHDLGEHMMEFHLPSCQTCKEIFEKQEDLADHQSSHKEESNSQRVNVDDIACNFCERYFPSNGDLMKHKKNDHITKVSTCWKYAAGACEFGDQLCWFSHDKPISSSIITCNVCKEICSIQPEYLLHRKTKHATLVSMCKNNVKGT